jgi:hypothetical protein
VHGGGQGLVAHREHDTVHAPQVVPTECPGAGNEFAGNRGSVARSADESFHEDTGRGQLPPDGAADAARPDNGDT